MPSRLGGWCDSTREIERASRLVNLEEQPLHLGQRRRERVLHVVNRDGEEAHCLHELVESQRALQWAIILTVKQRDKGG